MNPERQGPAPSPTTRLWTAKETARHLGIHVKTLYAWIRTRSFPCVYVGTRLRFDRSDVLRWISARKEGG